MIRPAEHADLEAIQAIYRPYVVDSVASFEEEVPAVEDLAGRIARSHEWLVAEAGGRVVGYAYAAPFRDRAAYRWSVEMSVYLGSGHQGKGLGKALISELIERVTRRGFVNAFAGVTLPNPASVALFESLGFHKIAHQSNVGFKHGAWHDVGWWQLQLRELPADPPEPELWRDTSDEPRR